MPKWAALILLILIAAPIGGCASRPAAECDGWKPIYLDPADRVSEGTKRELVAHNEFGEKKCGWKPAN